MARARHAALALALATAAGCGEFESPSIVLDLRVLGMSAGPPEVIVPPDPSEVSLADLPAIEVCALVADPREGCDLTYDFTACPPTDVSRL